MNEALYWSGWSGVLLFFAGGLLFVGLALLVARLIRPHRPNPQKLTAYESGEQPQGNAWVQFNMRYYVIALIFLLFEVEIVFLFPWATVLMDEEMMTANANWGFWLAIEMTVFVAVLAVGLVYAWVNGHLDAVKPKPQRTEFKSVVPREFYNQINQQYMKK